MGKGRTGEKNRKVERLKGVKVKSRNVEQY